MPNLQRLNHTAKDVIPIKNNPRVEKRSADFTRSDEGYFDTPAPLIMKRIQKP